MVLSRRICSAALGLAALLFHCPPAAAGNAHIAVAANFSDAAKEIGAAFAKASGHHITFSFGATGQLFTQISQGAPFDAFLAADDVTPAKAIDGRLAVQGSRFTYATGKIVLFSTNSELVKGEATLRAAMFRRIAIANPDMAPYGMAALQTMQALGVYDQLKPRIVQGNSIAQTYQFIATGNAELGFVALSQVASSREGSHWLVPASLYAPIAQDAVLLKRGAANEAAQAFLTFLKGSEARQVIARYGYGAGNEK